MAPNLTVEWVENQLTDITMVLLSRKSASCQDIFFRSGTDLLGVGLGGGWFPDIGRRLAADVTVPWTPFRWHSGYGDSRQGTSGLTPDSLAAYLYTPDTVTYPGRHRSPNSGRKKIQVPNNESSGQSSAQQKKIDNSLSASREMQSESRSERAGETKEGMTSILKWKSQARSAAGNNF